MKMDLDVGFLEQNAALNAYHTAIEMMSEMISSSIIRNHYKVPWRIGFSSGAT